MGKRFHRNLRAKLKRYNKKDIHFDKAYFLTSDFAL